MILNKKKTYLGKRGYIIFKDSFTEKELADIRKQLTVTPNIPNDYNDKIKTFKVFLENKNKMYLPKFFGINKIGPPCANKIKSGDEIDINFVFKLRDDQKNPINVAIEKYNSVGGGILHLQCGFGKTIMACYLIAKMKRKTLVIVHKEFLVGQWKERISQSLPSAKVGTIQGDVFDVEGKDIVIGMLQTLWMRDFELDAFDSFGHVVIDECHRIPSEKFSKALQKVSSTYMLGLSATPTRKDGLTKILKWHIGDIIFSMKTKNINEVHVDRVIIKSLNTDYGNELIDFRGRVKMSTMINHIAYFKIRTYAIIKVIVDTLNEHKDRQILLLSDRKQQLEDIYKMVNKHEYCSVGYYVGGMKQNKLKESESCQLILATYSMAKEGLDIKSLNCLILATPKSDIIQAVGRILRQKHENLFPKIIDVVDNFSIFKNQGKKRFDLFRKRKYKIKDIILDIDNIKVLSTKNYNYHINDTKNNTKNTKNTKKKEIHLAFSKGFCK